MLKVVKVKRVPLTGLMPSAPSDSQTRLAEVAARRWKVEGQTLTSPAGGLRSACYPDLQLRSPSEGDSGLPFNACACDPLHDLALEEDKQQEQR